MVFSLSWYRYNRKFLYTRPPTYFPLYFPQYPNLSQPLPPTNQINLKHYSHNTFATQPINKPIKPFQLTTTNQNQTKNHDNIQISPTKTPVNLTLPTSNVHSSQHLLSSKIKKLIKIPYKSKLEHLNQHSIYQALSSHPLNH